MSYHAKFQGSVVKNMALAPVPRFLYLYLANNLSLFGFYGNGFKCDAKIDYKWCTGSVFDEIGYVSWLLHKGEPNECQIISQRYEILRTGTQAIVLIQEP